MTVLYPWHHTLLCVIYLSLVMSANIPTKVVEEITYKMRYNWGYKISSNWSTTSKGSDYSSAYPVIADFTVHSPTIERFVEDFPYVTIQTYGTAVSGETFGDVGAGKFGSLTFETKNFESTDYRNKPIVNAHTSHFTFDVGVGFKNEGNKLYLRPYTNGWIYSVGAKWRTLEFGLGVTSITFHPKSNSKIM